MKNEVRKIYESKSTDAYAGIFKDVGFLLMHDKTKQDSVDGGEHIKVTVNEITVINSMNLIPVSEEHADMIITYVNVEYEILLPDNNKTKNRIKELKKMAYDNMDDGDIGIELDCIDSKLREEYDKLIYCDRD